MRLRRFLKWAGLALFVLFVVAQAIRPARTNPPIEPGETLLATTPTAADVQPLLDRACADCHSNRTTWPWYSQVAPTPGCWSTM